MTDKPLSDAVRGGWKIVGYSAHDMGGTAAYHNVILERQGQHKVLTIRKKMLGEGIVVEELEV